MKPQRLFLACVLGCAAATASAQWDQALRWRGAAASPLGLRPAQVDLRVGMVPASPIDRLLGRVASPGLDLRWTPAAGGEPADLGVYGRLGTLEASHRPGFGGAVGNGLTYGVGLRWDFSPRASAVLGWDSYDMRTAVGERDVQATSLGLQIRY